MDEILNNLCKNGRFINHTSKVKHEVKDACTPTEIAKIIIFIKQCSFE